MTRILGAILAGGAARRFGSDKAMALIDGAPMIRHVMNALAPQVDALILCGRTMPGLASVADRPMPGLGPLGGLAAALHLGREQGFDAVLSAPCDAPDLPGDLRAALGQFGPGHLIDQPVIGLWPCTLADAIDAHLKSDLRSLHSWIARIDSHGVTLPKPLANINTIADLSHWRVGSDAQ